MKAMILLSRKKVHLVGKITINILTNFDATCKTKDA